MSRSYRKVCPKHNETYWVRGSRGGCLTCADEESAANNTFARLQRQHSIDDFIAMLAEPEVQAFILDIISKKGGE